MKKTLLFLASFALLSIAAVFIQGCGSTDSSENGIRIETSLKAQ